MTLFGLPSEERLKSKKSITSLFSQGKTVKKYPLICKYILEEAAQPGIQVGFSVPKRSFKRAVDRNLLKRRMREAYRLNVPDFRERINGSDFRIHIMWLYTGKEVFPSTYISKSMIQLLGRLEQEVWD